MRIMIFTVNLTLAAIGLGLALCGGASARARDCAAEDIEPRIAGCSLIIQGRAKGNVGAAYYNRGHAFLYKGDYDRAIADFSEAIQLEPKFVALAYGNRGVAYAGKGDYGRAVADLSEAIRLKPKSALTYIGRGTAYYFWKHDYDRAIADFSEAIRLDPKNALAYNNRGWTLYKKGVYESAKADVEEALRLRRLKPAWEKLLPGDIPKKARGHILLALGNASGALADFNEALGFNPNSVGSLWGRGQVYERQGLGSLALADYKKAIELKPADPDDIEAQNQARARLLALETPKAAAAQEDGQAQKPAPMGRRVALVIGNGAYRAVAQLSNPKNDAAAIAGELARLGFEVVERHDLDAAAMRKALSEFEDKAASADWGVVYYAGHGMELNGKNWLIPIDARLARASDVPDETVQLDRVLERLGGAKKLRLVMLDACRNNPFLARMAMSGASRAAARGLARIEPSPGEAVFYAARDGSVAADGDAANSPFAAALVKHMDEEGLELNRLFRKVTASVLAATGHKQEPFLYGTLPDEDFYFRPTK